MKPTILHANNFTQTLYKEDAFKVLAEIPDSSIDSVVTDPPYGIKIKDSHSKTDNWDSLSQVEYKAFMIKLFQEISRVLKQGSQAWVFYGITQIETVIQAFHEANTDLQINWENALVYARNKGRGSSKKIKSLREEILHISKGTPTVWNAVEYCRRVIVPYVKDGLPRGWALSLDDGLPYRFTGAGSVMFFTAPSWVSKREIQRHTCQKPLLLNSALIMMTTKQGDTVLDLFMGSGSSGVAAALCDRNYIGVEKEPEVFAKAVDWIKNADYDDLGNEYVKKRLSSMEKNFKFGADKRAILPKSIK